MTCLLICFQLMRQHREAQSDDADSFESSRATSLTDINTASSSMEKAKQKRYTEQLRSQVSARDTSGSISGNAAASKSSTQGAGKGKAPVSTRTVDQDDYIWPQTGPSGGGGGCDGCFSGDSLVTMANGETKFVPDIRKGDRVVCNLEGRTAKVLCVLALRVGHGRCGMVSISDGLKITARHPILVNGMWSDPKDMGVVKGTACRFVYNVLLESEGTIVVGGVTCVALGHELLGVKAHEFWGNRERIVEELRRVDAKGFQKGRVEITGTKRDAVTGRVCGFRGSEPRDLV